MIYSGVTGSVKLSKNSTKSIINHLSGFELEITSELQEDISFGSQWKGRFSGLKDWSVSFEGSASFDDGSLQVDLVNALYEGNEISVGLYLDETTYFEGNCIIENCSISNAADGKAEISFSASGNGELTKAIVSSGENQAAGA